MSAAESTSIDLIRELRLRQWARTHYTSAAARSASWHPIVLDEMRRRDEELSESKLLHAAPRSLYVPLAPSDVPNLAEAS